MSLGGEEKEIMLEACQRAGGVNAKCIIAEYTRKMEALGKKPRGFGACLGWIQSWRSETGSRVRIKWTSDLRQLVKTLKREGNSARQISEIVSAKLDKPVSIQQVWYALRDTGSGQVKRETDKVEENLISTEVAEASVTSDTDTEDEFEPTSTTETTDESTSSTETTSFVTLSGEGNTETRSSVESQTATGEKLTDVLQHLAGAYKILADFTITRLNDTTPVPLTRSDVAIRSFVDGFKDTVLVADRVRFIRLLATDQVTATMLCGMDEDSRRFLVDDFLADYQLQL